MSLVSNRSLIKEKNEKSYKLLCQLQELVSKITPRVVLESISSEVIQDILAIINCNAFGIWNKKLENQRGIYNEETY
jgi:hypothetical protein